MATIIWTNLHGGFVAGIVMVGAYGCGELLQFALSPDREAGRAARSQALRYFACVFACLAASLVNPYTYHLHQHIISYLGDPYYSLHISEFFSLSFHHPVAIFSKPCFCWALAARFWSFKRGSYTEGVLLLVWAHGALLATRNIPLFMIVAVPPVAAMLADWLAYVPESNVAGWLRRAAGKFNAAGGGHDGDRQDRPLACGELCRRVAGGCAGYSLPIRPKVSAPSSTRRVTRFGRSNDCTATPGARIFAPDQWGDYLIYRLYPRTRVFSTAAAIFTDPISCRRPSMSST